MSVGCDFYLIDQEELIDCLDSKLDGQSTVDRAEEIDAACSNSDCSWVAFTFEEIRDKIPDEIRNDIDEYITKYCSFGALDHHAPFDYPDKSLRGDRPNPFLIMSRESLEHFDHLFEQCRWDQLEQYYETHYEKNDPAETFESFMQTIRDAHQLIAEALKQDKSLIGRIG